MGQTREEIVIGRNMDFLNTFTSPAGIRVMTYLSRYCLENHTTYVEGSSHKSAFNEGARSVMLEIRHWLDMDMSKLTKE